jgi:hypothetical protein
MFRLNASFRSCFEEFLQATVPEALDHSV